ncbi:hypothetical protein GE061_015984 [Apolygus lucorum]|uniref:Ig-like domain-containing protein n=1 Tax=Apolygus lucorum TaxID=248454 RepID=A0A8S9XEX0_APOLU|nr:hypothetical protein GE061_015984 [Apolygus lucorum]
MILELLMILVAVPQIPGDCQQCECKWKSGKDSAICSNRNLTRIPAQLGEGTQILDFTGNPVSSIAKDAFNVAGLLNLQKIFFSKCRVRTIDKYAFRKLNNLVELDLSYNILSAVPSHTFDSIPELRELKLSGNPIRKVLNDAFVGVPQLVKLELSECQISFLEPRAFFGLESTLEWLKLDQNRLAESKSGTITSLINLHGLELAGNPWNCTCHLRQLRQWITNPKKLFSSDPPGCRSPARVAGKTWDKLSVDDFACRPTISPISPVVLAEESTNATMSCTVFGSPQPSVKWMWKNRPIANATGATIPAHKKTYVLNHSDNKTSLTIYSVEPSDTGLYFCVAFNKAGKVEGNVTLTVNRQNPESKLSGKILLSGAVVALLFLVASCLLLCLLGQPKKTRTTVQADNYEKIEMDKKNARYSDIPSTNKVHPKMCEYRGVPSAEEADVDEEAGTPCSQASEQGRVALVPFASRDAAPTELYPELSGVQQHILRKEVLPSGSLYTTAATTYEDRGRERERNYPDLVSAPPATAVLSSATLPRSKNWYPRVSSSQSPLLAGSRCGSSADDSTGSNRRFSSESRSSSYYRLARVGDRSASSLNLDQELSGHPMKSKQWHHPSLPTSPVRHRPIDGPHLPGQSETPILNLLGTAVYDYHAAQLERFLEEYRSLQDQLNKMKETCEGFLEQPKPELAPDPYAHNRYTSSSIYNDLYRT